MPAVRRQQPRQEESIYSLIKQTEAPAAAPAIYRSRYPPNVPPTASTFVSAKYSQAPVSNIAGDYNEIIPSKNPHSLWGPREDARPDPTQFLKKHTLNARKQTNQTHNFTYADRRKEPLIVSAETQHELTSRPISGKRRNFIAENTMRAVTMKPPARVIKDSDVDYTKKPDYGRVPNYIDGVREEINREKEYINHLMEQQRQRRSQHYNVQQPQMRQLSEDERQEMVHNLKLKWNEVNREYQKTTHIVNLDTRGKIRRKEEYEQELAQLEKSIEKLSKEVVFVMDD